MVTIWQFSDMVSPRLRAHRPQLPGGNDTQIARPVLLLEWSAKQRDGRRALLDIISPETRRKAFSDPGDHRAETAAANRDVDDRCAVAPPAGLATVGC